MVKEAIRNPLFTFPPKKDSYGINVKIIGKEATIVTNPDTGKLITVWETSSKKKLEYGK
jgi:hypothetical protein